MRVGFERGLSERELASAREFREFCKAEAVKQREAEDRAAYQTYVDGLSVEQQHVPDAYRVALLSFEEWRKLMPGDQPDPTIRGLVATRTALTRKHISHYRDRVANESLTDEELEDLGFDLRKRPVDGSEVNLVLLRQSFDTFCALRPEYNHDLHFDQLRKFVSRYQLDPTLHNIESAFSVLWHLRFVEPPAPEPERDPQLNAYGVNLHLAPPSPEFERQQKRQAYYNNPVVSDPRDGRTFTAYQLDQLSADEYRRLMLGEFRTPRITDVIRPGLK